MNDEQRRNGGPDDAPDQKRGGIKKPFRRTCRPFSNGDYLPHGNSGFIDHLKFANVPQQYIRAFLVIQKDLLELFDYVEPADKNEKCYSYRIHELLMRSCIEIEANCTAILTENGYRKSDLKMTDYHKLNGTHRLSSYQVKFPVWHGDRAVRTPFSAWENGPTLKWYQAYNKTKHDRHGRFEQANFESLLDAAAGLVALLTSQFGDRDFVHPYVPQMVDDTFVGDGFGTAVGKYFRVKYPDDWPEGERYDFRWEQLGNDQDPFQLLFNG
jgi:hypothetical protein